MAGVIYVGHIPYGFFEHEIRRYFKQFGTVTGVRVPRSKKTGNAKGFAFVRFANHTAAKIAAEAMNNYLMFERVLKCSLVPESKVKKWFLHATPRYQHCHKRSTRIAEEHNSYKDEKKALKLGSRLKKRLAKKNRKFASKGIDYRFEIPKFKPEQELKTEIKDEPQLKKEEETSLDGDLEEAYSMILDSSDDEITFKTPPKAVKMRRIKDRKGTVPGATVLLEKIKEEEEPPDSDTKSSTKRTRSFPSTKKSETGRIFQ